MRTVLLFSTTLTVVLKSNIPKGFPRMHATYLQHLIADFAMMGLEIYAMRRCEDPQPVLRIGDMLGELHLDLLYTSGEFGETAHIAIAVEMELDEANSDRVPAIIDAMMCDFHRGAVLRKPLAVQDIIFGEFKEITRFTRTKEDTS